MIFLPKRAVNAKLKVAAIRSGKSLDRVTTEITEGCEMGRVEKKM